MLQSMSVCSLACSRIGSHRDVGPDVVKLTNGSRVDQRVGRAAVVGEEDVVAGVGVARAMRVPRHRRLDVVERRGRSSSWCVLDRAALGHRGDRDGGRVGAAVAVDVEDLLLGLVAGLAGQREVDREPVGGPAGGEDADDEHHQPEQHHQLAVAQDELGETDHRADSPAGGGGGSDVRGDHRRSADSSPRVQGAFRGIPDPFGANSDKSDSRRQQPSQTAPSPGSRWGRSPSSGDAGEQHPVVRRQVDRLRRRG